MKQLALVAFVLGGCIIPVQPGAQQPSGGGGYYGGQPMGGGGGYNNNPPPSNGYNSPPPSNGYNGNNNNGGGAAPMPTSVSVTIRSECGQTVKVFYGDKPKYGSGTNSSISSHSQESHTFRPGDMMWIIDDSENGVASTSVGVGTREIDISSGCTSLNAR